MRRVDSQAPAELPGETSPPYMQGRERLKKAAGPSRWVGGRFDKQRACMYEVCPERPQDPY